MTKQIKHVLLVGGDAGEARSLAELIARSGMPVTQASSIGDAEEQLAAREIDVVLLDLALPDAPGLSAVRRMLAAAPEVPVVVLAGPDDERLAVHALREGAQDSLAKGHLETRTLIRTLRHAVERKILEVMARAEIERAQITLDSIGDAVICTDLDGAITFLNQTAEQLTGWPRDEAMGRPIGEVFRVLGGGPDAPGAAALHETQGAPLLLDCVLVRRDGFEIAIEDSVASINDRTGQPTGSVTVFRDVTGARAVALQLAYAAQHDFLTGLPNRQLLLDRIGQAIALARRHKRSIAVLFLDIDRLKHVNDSLGHTVGDALLQSIATRLRDCARASDTVSRLGGDEFVVLLSEMQHSEEAATAARRILQSIAEPHVVDGHEIHVTASVGVSVFPDDGASAETLIKNADTAMYQAKQHGRRGYRYFEPAMNARAIERQFIEASLRRALERQELGLHYQPKFDFRTGAITGAEALLRWTHPTRGVLTPAEFIAVAEDCGLILPIGAWVLREACKQARTWVDAGLPVTSMAVNVSAVELRDEAFVETLFGILHDTALDPSLLEIELTESILMKHAEPAATVLWALRKQGVQVALDDFGTGYSSLGYLRKFPIDALKIDPSFVAQISAVEDDAQIVTAVIGMARSLKLRVVAEGVETQQQSRFLREHACDEAQGFYFGHPVPPLEFARLFARE